MNIKKILGLLCLLLSISMQTAKAQEVTAYSYHKPLFDFDYNKTTFKLENEQLSNNNRSLRYSLLTGYREGVKPIDALYNSNFKRINDRPSGTARIVAYNVSAVELLYHFPIQASRVILEVKDPSKYRYLPEYGDKEAWLRKNAVCYEYLLPYGIAEMPVLLNMDIAYRLGVKMGWEKRTVKTLVLVRTSAIDKIKANGSDVFLDGSNGIFKTAQLAWLGDKIEKAGALPVKDETGYQGDVDLDLQDVRDWKDVQALRKALQRYDLDLKEEMREMTMYVIKETK